MSRPAYTYAVMHLGSSMPLAIFTVKYLSEGWARSYAERTGISIKELRRFRYREPGIGTHDPVLCPWEKL